MDMEKQSASCLRRSLSTSEKTEHKFVKGVARRSFMDAADAVAIHRPKRSWPFLTADLTSRCTAFDNTKPKSPGISTKTPTEGHKSELVISTDADTTIPITDAIIQDISWTTSSSSEDAAPVNNILVEKNPAKDNILQDNVCLKTDVVAVDNTSLQSTVISTVSHDEVNRSELVISTDVDTTVPITDANIQDISWTTSSSSSSEDAVPVNNILIEKNPAKENTLQDTVCLETDVAAVDSTSLQSAVISTVSHDDHPLEDNSASDSAREVKEMNSRKVSCAATETSIQCSSFSYSSRLILYKDAKISDCCDSFKPRSSPNYNAIPDCEIMNQYCKKFHKQRRKDKPQRAKRKWKKVPNEMQLNLRTSLFPRTGIIISGNSIDDIEENEIWQELELFQSALQSCEEKENVNAEINETFTGAVSNVQESIADCEDKETVETQQMCEQLDTDINKNSVDFKSSISINVSVQENSSGHDTNEILPELNSELCKFKRKLDLDCENIENVTFYENKIPFRNFSDLERFTGLTNKKLRVKKKWKETKARVQIKTKYCHSLSNSVHGQTFYIHHRVMKLMPMVLEPRTYAVPFSLKRIDAAKGLAFGCHKEVIGTNSVLPGGHTRWSPANHSAATSRFAVDAFNADGDLSADVVNIMINLQHRDLLPEDYDLLLRLDDRVKPKTVDFAILTELKTERVICECEVLDVCAVCLDPYEVGQTKKYLPCQHYFHELCIDNWLSNSSMNCPLDATPVLPS